MAFARKSTINTLIDESVPLLKFENDKAYLSDKGMAKLASLKGRIYPVIFMGDGRAGKSYLASRLLDLEETEGFISSDSAEPVTEGIDIYVQDVQKLVNGCPGTGDVEALEETSEPINMVVLDCEGGNNAMAAIRTLVNVFGILIGTEVVFVTGGHFSESAFQTLDATIAARSLIKFDQDNALPEQRLVFVVNKNMLKYDENALEKAINAEQTDPARKEARMMVKETFAHRAFMSVPIMGLPDFEGAVTSLRQKILRDTRPLTMGDTPVTGTTICGVLNLIVKQMQEQNEVSMPSMNRCVIVDGFLAPLRDRLFKEMQNAWGDKFTDYDEALQTNDPRGSYIAMFEKESSHIRAKQLVAEIKSDLEERMKIVWDALIVTNEAFGDQAKQTRVEYQEVLGIEESRPVGGGGMLRGVLLTHQHRRVLMRTVLVKKNGKEIAEEWTECQGESWKLKEDAFAGLSTSLPLLQGKVLKRSPNPVHTVLSGGHGKYQQRCFVVREGFVIWWDPKKVPMPARTDSEVVKSKKERVLVQGCLNFLLNKAQVVKEDEQNFTIKPECESEGWSDPTGFSRGQNRHLHFSVGTREAMGTEYHTVDRWVQVIQQNIDFACRARVQLGYPRIISEVGSRVPCLQQAIWKNS